MTEENKELDSKINEAMKRLEQMTAYISAAGKKASDVVNNFQALLDTCEDLTPEQGEQLMRAAMANTTIPMPISVVLYLTTFYFEALAKEKSDADNQ